MKVKIDFEMFVKTDFDMPVSTEFEIIVNNDFEMVHICAITLSAINSTLFLAL